MNLEHFFVQAADHLEQQRWSEAIDAFENIIAVDPEYKDSASKLEEAKQRKEGDELFQDWQTALDRFLEIVSLGTYREDTLDEWLEETRKRVNLKILYAQAIGYFVEKDWQKAVGKFEKVLDLDKDYLDAAVKRDEARRQENLERQYEQGIKYLEQKKWDAAIQKLGEIVRLEPQYKDVHTKIEEARGLDHFDKGNWTGAIRAFERVLATVPDNKAVEEKLNEAKEQRKLSSLYDKARKREKTQEWEEARKLYEGILEIDLRYRDAFDRLKMAENFCHLIRLRREADQHLAAQQWESAIEDLDQIIKLNREYRALGWHSRGAINSKMNLAKNKLREQGVALRSKKKGWAMKPPQKDLITIFIGVLLPLFLNAILESLETGERLWLTGSLLILATAFHFIFQERDQD